MILAKALLFTTAVLSQNPALSATLAHGDRLKAARCQYELSSPESPEAWQGYRAYLWDAVSNPEQYLKSLALPVDPNSTKITELLNQNPGGDAAFVAGIKGSYSSRALRVMRASRNNPSAVARNIALQKIFANQGLAPAIEGVVNEGTVNTIIRRSMLSSSISELQFALEEGTGAGILMDRIYYAVSLGRFVNDSTLAVGTSATDLGNFLDLSIETMRGLGIKPGDFQGLLGRNSQGQTVYQLIDFDRYEFEPPKNRSAYLEQNVRGEDVVPWWILQNPLLGDLINASR